MIEKQKKEQHKINSFMLLGIAKDKEYFIENFSILLSSGIDVMSAINAIENEMKSAGMKKIIKYFKDDLEAGLSLSTALENTKIFPNFIFSLVKIGEENGKLAENLELIVKQQKKDRIFRSKIQSAMVYPVFVMVLALVIGIGISWYILPKLSTVFAGMNIKLPVITKILMAIGFFMNKNGIIILPSFFAVFLMIFYFLFFFSKTKFVGQKIFLHLPGIRSLIQEVELARTGFVVGILLNAGLPIVESIKTVSSSTTIYDYKKLYFFIAEKLEEGLTFHEIFDSIKANTLISSSVQQIIIAGAQSGKLEGAFKRIGELYEEKTENTTKYLSTILEPLLLVIVWFGVVFVALAVILPIYSLIGGFNSNAMP